MHKNPLVVPCHSCFLKTISVLAISLLVGCYSIKPMTAYRGYGEYLPERDEDVLAKAREGKIDTSGVKFLQESLPKGIFFKNQTFGVEDGYKHQLIGKIAVSESKYVEKFGLVAKVKRIAAAAGGDIAIGLFIGTDPAAYQKAQAVEAIVVKLESRIQEPVAKERALAPAVSRQRATLPRRR